MSASSLHRESTDSLIYAEFNYYGVSITCMCRCGKCINVGRMCGWCPLTFTCHSITSESNETDICPTGEVGNNRT